MENSLGVSRLHVASKLQLRAAGNVVSNLALRGGASAVQLEAVQVLQL